MASQAKPGKPLDKAEADQLEENVRLAGFCDKPAGGCE